MVSIRRALIRGRRKNRYAHTTESARIRIGSDLTRSENSLISYGTKLVVSIGQFWYSNSQDVHLIRPNHYKLAPIHGENAF